MSISPQIKCDLPGCGVTRKETNHWWAVRCKDGHSITIYWWDAQTFDELAATKHFCGADHALKFASLAMAKKSEATV